MRGPFPDSLESRRSRHLQLMGELKALQFADLSPRALRTRSSAIERELVALRHELEARSSVKRRRSGMRLAMWLRAPERVAC